MPRSSVNLGSTNPDSSAASRAQAPHQVGDLLRRTDPDEEKRQVTAGVRGKVGELADDVPLGVGDLGVLDGVLQAQHHGHHATSGLFADGVGQCGPGGGGVEGRSQGDREHPGGRVGGEVARLPVEEALTHLRGDVPEMTHDSPREAGMFRRNVAGNST